MEEEILIKYIYDPKKINLIKSDKIIVSKKVRHPFQVINISSYPFWIGFSLFWIFLWFGLFFLNAEWAKVALKDTMFDLRTNINFFAPILHKSSSGFLDWLFRINPSIGPLIFEWYAHTIWFEWYFLFSTVPILPPFKDTFVEWIIQHSYIIKYSIYPVLYWFYFNFLDYLLELGFKLIWIMETSIFDDLWYSIINSEIVLWSLVKYTVPIFFAFRLGCPFKLFTLSWTIYLLNFIAWMVFANIMVAILIFYDIITTIPFGFLWMMITSIIIGSIVKGIVLLYVSFLCFLNYWFIKASFLLLIIMTWRWMSDISIEGRRGEHTTAVQQNLLWGAYLFMMTEVIIFITLFQTTFYYSRNPAAETSQLWIYPGIVPPYSVGLGLANLLLLLSSGWIIQRARKHILAYWDFLIFKRTGEKKINGATHFWGYILNLAMETETDWVIRTAKRLNDRYIFDGRMKRFVTSEQLVQGPITQKEREDLNKILKKASQSTLKTIILGTIFMIFQYIEYSNLSFSISSGIYGTCFFCLTGLHGFHVIVGLILLAIWCYQLKTKNFPTDESIFFWFSVRYWQFVDIVWIFVWITFYFTWESFYLVLKELSTLFSN